MSPDRTRQLELTIATAMSSQAPQLLTAGLETAESASLLPPRPSSSSEQVRQRLAMTS